MLLQITEMQTTLVYWSYCQLPIQVSPRHMHEYTQEAMTNEKIYRIPDLLVTLICQPGYSKMSTSGQSANRSHDLIARIFRQKLMEEVKLKCSLRQTIRK